MLVIDDRISEFLCVELHRGILSSYHTDIFDNVIVSVVALGQIARQSLKPRVLGEPKRVYIYLHIESIE